nr:MAG TPA: hypothetical protein [Caudoviricetes sp.]
MSHGTAALTRSTSNTNCARPRQISRSFIKRCHRRGDGYSRATHCAEGGKTPEGLSEDCLSAHRLRPARREEGR